MRTRKGPQWKQQSNPNTTGDRTILEKPFNSSYHKTPSSAFLHLHNLWEQKKKSLTRQTADVMMLAGGQSFTFLPYGADLCTNDSSTFSGLRGIHVAYFCLCQREKCVFAEVCLSSVHHLFLTEIWGVISAQFKTWQPLCQKLIASLANTPKSSSWALNKQQSKRTAGEGVCYASGLKRA